MKEKFVYVQEFKCIRPAVLEEQLSLIEKFYKYDLPDEVPEFENKIELIVKGTETVLRLTIICKQSDALKLAIAANEYFSYFPDDWKY